MRNHVEGKFGQGKRRFGLGRLMAKLALTSETMIQVSFLVMNLEHLLTRAVFDWLFSWWQGWRRMWNGLLGALWRTMKTDFWDYRGYGIEGSGGRSPQFLAGV